MEEKDEIIYENMVDTLLGRPIEFTAGGRHYYLNRASLGMHLIIARYMKMLGLDALEGGSVPLAAILHAVSENRDAALYILVHYTIDTKAKHFKSAVVEGRKRFLDKALSDEEVAELIALILTLDNVDSYKRQAGIEEDEKVRKMAMDAKSRQNSLFFGGKSIFGSLIGVACEKFGWKYDYVVWGIPLADLLMLLSDEMTSMYMSDDEMKRFRQGGGVAGGGKKGGKGMNFGQFLAALHEIKGGR